MSRCFFGGNPLAAAVARTALKVLIEEGTIENAANLGTYFYLSNLAHSELSFSFRQKQPVADQIGTWIGPTSL